MVLSNKFQVSNEECVRQLRLLESKIFILKFGDVTRVERPSLRTELLDIGIIKSAEYYDNLKDALVKPKDDL